MAGIKYFLFIFLILLITFNFPSVVFADPQSQHYTFKDYSFGGSSGVSSSNNYSIMGTAGEGVAGNASSSGYSLGEGLAFTFNANVPSAPSFTNPSNYYNKLRLVINTGGNPDDTQFAIAVSPDAFISTTKYVQADNTLGNSPVWQTNAVWGAGGFNIIGLTPGTTYTAKVTAVQGIFTQSQYGPTAQASTVNPTLSFDIDTTVTDQETAPPYVVDIGTLNPATVVTSPKKIWIDLTTNSNSGGSIYLYDNNSGLLSTSTSTTISSVSNDLNSILTGYGARSNSVSQASGGPMVAHAPYDGTGDNVGILDSNKRVIYDSSNSPVTGGRVSFELKAKSTNTTPAAADYADTITIIASGAF